jgi:hypothetical protein
MESAGEERFVFYGSWTRERRLLLKAMGHPRGESCMQVRGD